MREFLAKVTGYSNSQLSRLIAQQRRTGHIRDHRLRPPSRPFATVYTTADALLLAEVDEALGQLSGPATKRALWRMYHVFGDKRFERLAEISNGHIYNLRGRRAYRNARTTFRTTRAAPSPIGQRRRPRPEGRPGFVRVDTVHSGDRDGEKGACVINMVDEVTQYQELASVPRITGYYMVPVLEALVSAFPFRVLAFHADNGSEYINHRVAAMLNKLHIEEFTKSRPRRSNDNALVESKNGNVVRRWLGHSHIPERLAPQANAFLRDFLSPFLNHHRACLFAIEVEGEDGRQRRKYPQELVMTPYEKLRSLPGADGFLKPGITFAQLDVVAHALTDLEAAQEVQRARKGLFPARCPGAEPRSVIHPAAPSAPPAGPFMLISGLENTWQPADASPLECREGFFHGLGRRRILHGLVARGLIVRRVVGTVLAPHLAARAHRGTGSAPLGGRPYPQPLDRFPCPCADLKSRCPCSSSSSWLVRAPHPTNRRTPIPLPPPIRPAQPPNPAPPWYDSSPKVRCSSASSQATEPRSRAPRWAGTGSWTSYSTLWSQVRLT